MWTIVVVDEDILDESANLTLFLPLALSIGVGETESPAENVCVGAIVVGLTLISSQIRGCSVATSRSPVLDL